MEKREGPSTRSRSRSAAAKPHAAAAAPSSLPAADAPPLPQSRACHHRREEAEGRGEGKEASQAAGSGNNADRRVLWAQTMATEICVRTPGKVKNWMDAQTHDLFVKGFHKEYDFGPFAYYDEFFDPYQILEWFDWETYFILDEKSWRSFAKKIRSRKNVVQKFILYADSSEILHYVVLLKATNGDYSQLAPVVLPGTKSLSRYNYLENRFNTTFYDSHNHALRFLQERIFGGFLDIQDTEVPGCEDLRSPSRVGGFHDPGCEDNQFRVLHRVFWAFAQCIQAFKYCRPVLCIKGTPLCGKYQGVLLTAVAVDANDCAVLVACAVVEGETKASWLWFLRNVKRGVVKERSGVCIIHEYKRELISAIDNIKNNQQEPHPWRDVQNRWCMEHLAENFLACFGDKELMTVFKLLCQQKRKSKFADIWKELDRLTLKYTAEKEGRANEQTQLEWVEHGQTRLEQKCCRKPMEQWSLLHDKNGARYGIMDTNVDDVHNLVLKWIKYLPLRGIAEVTFERMEAYLKNTSVASDPSMRYPVHVQEALNSELQKSKKHDVICMNIDDTNVSIGDFKVQWGHKNAIVHLNSAYTRSMDQSKGYIVWKSGKFSCNNKPQLLHKPKSKGYIIRKSAKCSCNKPQLLHKPCSHVIAVCRRIGVPAATYLSQYYSLSYLAKTRSEISDASKATQDGGISLPSSTTWIPDKKLECYLPVSLTPDRTETSMDRYEKQCIGKSESIARFEEPTFY
uniref:Uncharacterized protein n=1 Tax=Avena sativa TaxID=4498 RepID=A0ACD5YYN1_AVESA